MTAESLIDVCSEGKRRGLEVPRSPGSAHWLGERSFNMEGEGNGFRGAAGACGWAFNDLP